MILFSKGDGGAEKDFINAKSDVDMFMTIAKVDDEISKLLA